MNTNTCVEKPLMKPLWNKIVTQILYALEAGKSNMPYRQSIWVEPTNQLQANGLNVDDIPKHFAPYPQNTLTIKRDYLWLYYKVFKR